MDPRNKQLNELIGHEPMVGTKDQKKISMSICAYQRLFPLPVYYQMKPFNILEILLSGQ